MVALNEEKIVTFKNHTDIFFQQTRILPQETLEIRMNKQLENSSFSPPINLIEEGKWLMAVTSFEATKSVFNISIENKSFSITIPGHWETKSAEKSFDDLNKTIRA